MHRMLCVIALVIAVANVQQSWAQEVTRFQPSHDELIARYRREARIDSLTQNVVFKSSVRAHWAADGRSFWYCNVEKDSMRTYVLVDAVKGRKQPAFDVQRLAAGLRSAGQTVDALRIPVTDMRLQPGNSSFLVQVNGQWYSGTTDTYVFAPTVSPAEDVARSRGTMHQWERSADFQTDSISPDKKWVAFVQAGNVYVRPVSGGTPIQFTADGTTGQPYGALAWSPDSRYVVGYHIHPVEDAPVFYILTSVPGTTRGQLRSQPYKQPGDPFTTYTMYLFYLKQQAAVQVTTDVIDFFGAPELHWRAGNAGYFTYEKVDRGHQRFRVMEVNATTAQAKAVVDEKTNTFIYESRLFSYYLPATHQMIRSSEQDGWQHLYLTDLLTGKEQLITKGDWVVRSVDSVDVVKKEVWFSARGMNAGEDPYQLHFYRIGFDGRHLLSLTPEVGQHAVTYSTDKQFYIDSYSQVNVPPVTKLRRTADGREVMVLEEADVTLYQQTGVHPPEVFVAKARDGKTDIWGIVSKPSDYDPAKKYPVLENIYAGPQDAFVPKTFTPYSEMQSLAELGFIVVMIDGMGTANRSKAFHDVCWKNLADAGLPDRILWIKALAKKYSYVDAERVGIYGTSAGGQNTVSALLFHPEFYKAGVGSCGCQDNRVDKQWWNEQWMGYPVGKEYDEQSNVTNACKLQGNLMLIVGEADTNVPPESTYRLADALIKAGKKFDFLPVPGMGHSDGGPYGRMRKRDFFVQHLMGVEPPERNGRELPAGKETGRERWQFF